MARLSSTTLYCGAAAIVLIFAHSLFATADAASAETGTLVSVTSALKNKTEVLRNKTVSLNRKEKYT